jgi:glycosyltransferase involved in cell wall biosynthesis
MNILQLRGEFSDNGPGSQTLTISNELKSRGHNVIFCSSGGKLTEKILAHGFKYEIINELALENRNIFNVIKSIYKLSKIIKKENIEIIHTHNAASVFIANVASILTNKKVKVFQSVRGVEVRPNYQWRNLIYRLIKFEALFAVSQFTKDILVGFGIDSRKIIVTYNGTDLNRFDIKKKEDYNKEIRNEFNIPDNAKIIGIVGRQDGNKGHRLLIESFAKLYSKYKNLYIILVGEGTELKSNIQLAKDLNIFNRCIFTGLRLDVEKLHASFDIFTLLSKKGLEMFPNVIIESMSYGNTFVATNTTGVPETASNGEGFICECDNIDCFVEKFDLLLSNGMLRKKMGIQARNSVEKVFNITEVVNKIENAYGIFQ